VGRRRNVGRIVGGLRGSIRYAGIVTDIWSALDIRVCVMEFNKVPGHHPGNQFPLKAFNVHRSRSETPSWPRPCWGLRLRPGL